MTVVSLFFHLSHCFSGIFYNSKKIICAGVPFNPFNEIFFMQMSEIKQDLYSWKANVFQI